MSNINKNFLPTHPKIFRRVNNSSAASIQKSKQTSRTQEWEQQAMEQILRIQKEKTEALYQKVQELRNKNAMVEESFRFYNIQQQKKQLADRIVKMKNEEKEVSNKIKNCEKVEQSTTSEQYYLWQKKKKVDDFNAKYNLSILDTQEEKQRLEQIFQNFSEQTKKLKQEIQLLLQSIRQVQNNLIPEESVVEEQNITAENILLLKQQCQSLASDIGMLKQNNQILSSQLDNNIQIIEITLRKFFDSSKNTLLRDLQLIKRQFQNSSPMNIGQEKGRGHKIEDLINEYNKQLLSIQKLLSKEQLQQVNRIIKPFDWQSLQWQQYLDPENEQQQINYQEQFQNYNKIHESYQFQAQQIEAQIQQVVIEMMQLSQKNMQLQSAMNKISKLIPKK